MTIPDSTLFRSLNRKLGTYRAYAIWLAVIKGEDQLVNDITRKRIAADYWRSK